MFVMTAIAIVVLVVMHCKLRKKLQKITKIINDNGHEAKNGK